MTRTRGVCLVERVLEQLVQLRRGGERAPPLESIASDATWQRSVKVSEGRGKSGKVREG